MRTWVVLQLLMGIATLIAKVSDFWLQKTPFFGLSVVLRWDSRSFEFNCLGFWFLVADAMFPTIYGNVGPSSVYSYVIVIDSRALDF